MTKCKSTLWPRARYSEGEHVKKGGWRGPREDLKFN